jgi:hypothetical protein
MLTLLYAHHSTGMLITICKAATKALGGRFKIGYGKKAAHIDSLEVHE